MLRIVLFTLSILVVPTVSLAATTPLELYVAPDGKPDHRGTRESPLTLAAAVDRVTALCQQSGVPAGGVTIHVAGGRYAIETPIRIGSACRSTPDRPIVIEAIPGEQPVFDGGLPIDVASFEPVIDPVERQRLAASAADEILVTTVTDPRLVASLKRRVMLVLTIDGRAYQPAVFPNDGYARIDNTAIEPEVCPPGIPVGQQAYGVRAGTAPHREPDRPVGWKGSLSEPRGAWATIGDRADEMAGTWEQWEAEIGRDNARHDLTGFLDADWLLGSVPVAAVDASRQALHLSRVLGYGWAWRSHKPFKMFGLLCELDRPGEWHFDPLTNRLYVYPPGDDIAGDRSPTGPMSISIPTASSFITIDGAAFVSIIGLDVQSMAAGFAYDVRSGHDNLIASATVRSSTAGGVSIDGQRNRVVACDFVDLDRHVRLSGGQRGPDAITAGRNEVVNCHIYQRGFRHRKIGIGVGGVGNVFRNNLIHNSLGQPMTVNGNDHLIERNEFFNVGFDEGDGGAVYSGADLTGYGIVYRHNFFHHLMHVPGKVTRAGIHLDDLQAGSVCEGNIFYKSAEKGIFMNGGAGHRIIDNIFLEGKYGALNRGSGGLRNHQRQDRITTDPDSPHRGSKEDYVGRAERIVGERGWASSPWRERYPVFNVVMTDAGEHGRLWPIRCHVEGNCYYGNTGRDETIWDRVSPEARAKSTLLPDVQVSPDDLMDYEALDFRPRGEMAPDIPFGRIGLVLDDWRDAMPEKMSYRRAVRNFFHGIGSMPGTHRQIDTGRLVEEGPISRREPG